MTFGKRIVLGRVYSCTSYTQPHSGHVCITVNHYRTTPRYDTFVFTRIEDARKFADHLIAQIKASDWGVGE